jgi:Integrase core domain
VDGDKDSSVYVAVTTIPKVKSEFGAANAREFVSEQQQDENLAFAWKLARQNMAFIPLRMSFCITRKNVVGKLLMPYVYLWLAANVLLNWRTMIPILVHVTLKNALLRLVCGGRPWLQTFSNR